MSRRPLVFVIGLTLGDYFLWNWSLNHSHDVIALIAGLAFPPLALMLLWLLAVGAATLLGRITRRPAARPAPAARRNAAARQSAAAAQAARTGTQGDSGQGSREGAPARRIAA